jgi:murein DD-endopeptidase MepM/ murein hydrolase activator NlpD
MARPVLASGAAAALLTAGALVVTVGEGQAQAEALTFAVDGRTASTSSEQLEAEREDAARVAAARSATNTQRSVVAAREAERARAAAAAALAQRKAKAQAAARAAERKRIIANAKKDPKAAARQLMPEFGFGAGQWSCLDRLWIGESGWKWNAENPSSGAYGIPQSLPARKMATMGSDYRTNPVTQIRWGLDYIKKSYGTPCNALDQWNSRYPHWY